MISKVKSHEVKAVILSRINNNKARSSEEFRVSKSSKKLNNKGANSWQMTWGNATCVRTNRERERKRGEFFFLLCTVQVWRDGRPNVDSNPVFEPVTMTNRNGVRERNHQLVRLQIDKS